MKGYVAQTQLRNRQMDIVFAETKGVVFVKRRSKRVVSFLRRSGFGAHSFRPDRSMLMEPLVYVNCEIILHRLAA